MYAHHEHGMPTALVLILGVLVAVGANGCGGGTHGDADGSPTPARRTPEATEPPSGPAGAGAGVAWTHDALMRRLQGRRLRVGGRTVRIDPATLTCGGVGRPAGRVHGDPVWSRFRCVQPTFPPGAVAGPDAIFIVQPTGPHELVIRDRRLTRY
jgi:hypothetical protein